MTADIIGAALLVSACGFLLRGLGWRAAPIVMALAALAILRVAWEPLLYVVGSVKEVGEWAGVSEPLSAAVKILGIGYLFGMCADVCRELGEGGAAKAVETVGRVEIIAVVIPYFKEIVSVGAELLG